MPIPHLRLRQTEYKPSIATAWEMNNLRQVVNELELLHDITFQIHATSSVNWSSHESVKKFELSVDTVGDPLKVARQPHFESRPMG